MSSEEDDDLKALRTALLSSIRSKNQSDERSQEIYDTDIDDLEALRKAALKSVKPEVKSSNYNPANINSSSHLLKQNTLGHQFSAQFPLGTAQYQRFPPFRLRPPPVVLRPQIRSNLIVIQTMSDGSDVVSSSNNSSTTAFYPGTTSTSTSNVRTSQLILPQDRYSKTNNPSSSTAEKVKRNDKWSRFKEDSSSSDDDDDDEEDEINTVDEVNSSRSDESEQENELMSDECAGRMSPTVEGDVSFEEFQNSSSRNVEPYVSRISPSSDVATSSQQSNRMHLENGLQFSIEHNTDSSFSIESDQRIIDKSVEKRIPPPPKAEMKPNVLFDEFDFLLEEPSDSIEFLEDEPNDYDAIVASMNNNDPTTTDNDSSSSIDGTKVVSPTDKIKTEKELLKNKLNEVTQKLAEIKRRNVHERHDGSPSTKTKRKSSKNKHVVRSERKRRSDERDLPPCSRATNFGRSETLPYKTDRRSPAVLSSVVAVRQNSSSNELSPNKKRKRQGNSPELREHVLRKAALPSLFELKIERSKTSATREMSPAKSPTKAVCSQSKPEHNPINISKGGDLRAFLTSKKTGPTNVLPLTAMKNIPNKGKIIKLKKDVTISGDETFTAKSSRLDTNIRRTIVNNSATVNDEILNLNVKEKAVSKYLPSPVLVKETSSNRRVIIGGDKSVDDDVHNIHQRQGNRSFRDVHVQWKKTGADTIKEGKSTGGKIKLKRP